MTKYIKLYEEWLNQPVDKSDMTLLFLNGTITEKEWVDYYNIQTEKLNEAIGQVIKKGIDNVSKWITDKVVPWISQNLLSPIKSIYNWIMTQAAKATLNVMDLIGKIKTIFDKINGAIQGYKEKHPTLYKVIKYSLIVLTTIVLVGLYLYLTSQQAHAGGGEWVTAKQAFKQGAESAKQDELKALMGITEHLSQSIEGETMDEFNKNFNQELHRATAYFKDAMDGKITGSYSEGVLKVVNLMKENYNTYVQNNDTGIIKNMINLCNQAFGEGDKMLNQMQIAMGQTLPK